MFQIIRLELYFCLNGLLSSVQVWIMLDSHVKIIEKKLDETNTKKYHYVKGEEI